MPINKNSLIRFKQFVEFCRLQSSINDHDPHVQLYKLLVKELKLDIEEQLWLVILYMAYYDDGSGLCAFNLPGVRERQKLPYKEYPISLQRRNLYGGRINDHLRSWMKIPILKNYLVVDTWGQLIERLSNIHGNGRWSSYTTAEMLVEVCELSIPPDTYEIAGSSGPKRGLEFLGVLPTERSAQQIHRLVAKEGIKVPPHHFESMLCNWFRMNRGTFYAGRNIDRQQGRIIKVEKIMGGKLDLLWVLRKRIFPLLTLGELHGWSGIDRPRQKTYRDTYKVLQPWEGRLPITEGRISVTG